VNHFQVNVLLIGLYSVDITCCPIQQAINDQKLFYCIKCSYYVLKYEVLVHFVKFVECIMLVLTHLQFIIAFRHCYHKYYLVRQSGLIKVTQATTCSLFYTICLLEMNWAQPSRFGINCILEFIWSTLKGWTNVWRYGSTWKQHGSMTWVSIQ
jgi:hypothetical protein